MRHSFGHWNVNGSLLSFPDIGGIKVRESEKGVGVMDFRSLGVPRVFKMRKRV